MEYMLSIFTDDPDGEDIYYPNQGPSVGVAMCKPISIKASMLRNIKRQAETQIEKVLCYRYHNTDPDYVTHEIDLDAVWKYEDSTRTSLAKKVYAAYKDDFEGYKRYKAVLTPVQEAQ